VRGNTFNQSYAGEKGGAIFYDLYQPTGLSENKFHANLAKYGKDVASYAYSLKPIRNDTSWA
jgi:hypothetical protein